MRDPNDFDTLASLKRYKKQRQEVKETAQQLIKLLAVQSTVERDGARDGLTEALLQEHPTLRQSALSVLRDSCRDLQDMPVDMRSEGSKKLIEAIAAFDEPMPYV